MLTQLLAGQDRSTALVEDLRRQLDAAQWNQYREGVGVGWSNLRDASRPHRHPEDRQFLLEQAQQRFTSAVVTAPDSLAAVDAELMVAMCWLMRGCREDFFDSLLRAADSAFATCLREARKFAQPSGLREEYAKSETAFDRLRGMSNPARVTQARERLRDQALQRREEASQAFNSVQRLREEYGAPRQGCMRLAGYWSPGENALDYREKSPYPYSEVWHTNNPVLDWRGVNTLEWWGLRAVMYEMQPGQRQSDGTWLTHCTLSVSSLDANVRWKVSAEYPWLGRPTPATPPPPTLGVWDEPDAQPLQHSVVRAPISGVWRMRCHTLNKPKHLVLSWSRVNGDAERLLAQWPLEQGAPKIQVPPLSPVPSGSVNWLGDRSGLRLPRLGEY